MLLLFFPDLIGRFVAWLETQVIDDDIVQGGDCLAKSQWSYERRLERNRIARQVGHKIKPPLRQAAAAKVRELQIHRVALSGEICSSGRSRATVSDSSGRASTAPTIAASPARISDARTERTATDRTANNASACAGS